MCDDEKLCDSLYRWERWAQSNQTNNKDLIYSFKVNFFHKPLPNKTKINALKSVVCIHIENNAQLVYMFTLYQYM